MTKKVVDALILKNERLTEGVSRMVLSAPGIATEASPGQFVELAVGGGTLLRRPLSLNDVDRVEGTLTLVYREIGRGTRNLAAKREGESVSTLGPLGQGFSIAGERPLLVGGGMGIAPLLYLAKAYKGRAGVVLGGRTATELFWQEMFRDEAAEVFLTTDDGSLGRQGLAPDVLPDIIAGFDSVAACGPEPLMKAVAKIAADHNLPCQVSLERRMACGLGACLSCSIDTRSGRRKVCTDGPVFPAEEVFV